jgi:hypothetical protein
MEYSFGTGVGVPAVWRSPADVDLDGDGVPDAVALDFDGDGRVDDVMWDSDGNGVADTVVLDLDDDGHGEHYYDDPSRGWAPGMHLRPHLVPSRGSIAALLGASPGASTAVPVMINLLHECFPDRADDWRQQLVTMVPSYGQQLAENLELLADVHSSTAAGLHLNSDRAVEQLSA